MGMVSVCAALPSQLIIHRLHCSSKRPQILSISTNLKFNTFLSHFASTSRFNDAVKLQTKERVCVAYASNSNPSGGESSNDKSSDAAKGPPFFTIVAGFLVFLGIIWLFGSIIMWLFGLIVRVSK